MNKMNKFVGISIISLAIFAHNGHNVYANSITENELKIDELDKEKVEIKKEMENKKIKVEELALEVEMLKYNRISIEEEIEVNEKKLKEITKQIEETRDEIKVLENDIEKRKEVIGERLKAYQSKGNVNYLDILMGSEGIIDFFTRVSTLSTIVEADNEIMEKLTADLNSVEIKLKEVKKMEKDERKMKLENENKRDELNNNIEDTIEKQNELNIQINSLNISIEDIKNEQDKLMEEINESLGMKLGLGSGKLEWPTTSETYISSNIGYRTHPKTGEPESFHSGLDIARTNRSVVPPIYAAEDGVVIATGYIGSYGNTIKIKHANGVETLYAHLSSIDVIPGEEVRRGQTIGIMGTTGRSTGIHLHFEVTQDGKLQNPLRYIQ